MAKKISVKKVKPLKIKAPKKMKSVMAGSKYSKMWKGK